ncbi:hypothetical protein D3C72_2157740 [compost metagenome]
MDNYLEPRTSIDQSTDITENEDTIEEQYTYGSNLTNETVSENVQAEQSGFGCYRFSGTGNISNVSRKEPFL